MKKKNTIVTYNSLDEIPKGKTNWDKVNALTDKDIKKAIADDPDAAPVLDDEWFKKQGKGYQTSINAILQKYVDAHK